MLERIFSMKGRLMRSTPSISTLGVQERVALKRDKNGKVTTEASGNPSSPNPSSPAQEQDEDEGEGEEWELDSPENDKARIEDSFLPREQAALSDKAPGKSMKYYGRAGTKTAARFVKKHVKKPKFD